MLCVCRPYESLRELRHFQLSELDFGALGLQSDLAFGHRAPNAVVDEVAVHPGISDEDLETAENEYLSNKADTREFLEYKRRRRRELREHVFSYLIVNAMLVAVNWISSGKLTWAVWPILGWGVGLAFHAWATLNSDSESFQEEFEQFRRKQARRDQDRSV